MSERQCLRTELRENFYRPLWGAKKQSSSSIDGVVRCFPSEAPVGPLTRPSGLSRAQQLIVFDTLKIFLLPSFCSTHGGVSLDRAFPLLGTSYWWSTLLLRIKAQRCVQNGGSTISEKMWNACCGENYSLALKSKVLLGRKTALEASIGAENATNVKNLFRRLDLEEEDDVSRWNGIAGRVDFNHKFDLYKLILSCAFREKYQTHGSALALPAVLSTEIVSNDLHSPLHYRLGLHQILDVFPNAPDVTHDCANAVYFQGGIGIDGVATLFKSPGAAKSKDERLNKRRNVDLNSGFGFFLPFSKDRVWSLNKRNKTQSILRSGQFPSSPDVLSSLRQQATSLKKATEHMTTATKFIEAGKLKSLTNSKEDHLLDHKKGNKIFLPTPHLKIGGLAGVVSSFRFHKDGLDRMSLPESGFISPGMLRRRANLRWKSSLDETPIKAFVGCSISAQVGRMRRKLLSFTSALAQFECAIPISLGQTSLPRRIQTISASQRNLMIGSIPLRPLVNLSLVQQAIGPLRLKADYRVALESSAGVGSSMNLNRTNAFWRQMQTIRPCIVDAQFGFDFVIPGTQGAVKFGGWCAPSRKEAMAELRLF